MSDSTPRLGKLPFWLADAMLIATAAALVAYGSRPLGVWEMAAITVCVALGAWLAVTPFLREYDASVHLAHTDRLRETAVKLEQLDALAERIGAATSQWQTVQDTATRTAETSRQIVERLSREAETFATAVTRSSDAERQRSKLEIDKLRRAETDWLQAVGRVMDHIFALHVAAVRSNQPAVTEQIDRFHGACREALRRVGFNPVVAAPDEPFDPRKHQVAEGERPPEGARIDETVAPGFLYQGQLVRPIIVRCLAPGAERAASSEVAPARAAAGAGDAAGSEVGAS